MCIHVAILLLFIGGRSLLSSAEVIPFRKNPNVTGGLHFFPFSPVPKSLICSSRKISFFRRLLDSTYIQAPVYGHFWPINPSAHCLHAYNHWSFTASHVCPSTLRCGPAYHIEKHSGLHSLTICDGSHVAHDQPPIELRGPILFDRLALPSDFLHHLNGYYHIRNNIVRFLPLSCVSHVTPVRQQEELWYWPGMTGEVNWGIPTPITYKPDARVPLFASNASRPVQVHPFFSDDVYFAGEGQLCAHYIWANGTCALREYEFLKFINEFAVDPSCLDGTRFLSPQFLLHENRIGVQRYPYHHPISMFCKDIKSMSRPFIVVIIDTAFSYLIDAMEYLLPPLLSAISRVVTSLIDSLIASAALQPLIEFVVLHLALYQFTHQFYHHVAFLALFLVRISYFSNN